MDMGLLFQKREVSLFRRLAMAPPVITMEISVLALSIKIQRQHKLRNLKAMFGLTVVESKRACFR